MKTPNQHTVLGFDFGGKRIGIAIGVIVGQDPQQTRTSRALQTIASHQGVPDWPAISELINTWQPDTLIVGLPYNPPDASTPNGNGPQPNPQYSGDMATRAQRFSRQLHGRYQRPVALVDERWTSEAARADHAEQRALGISKAANKGDRDCLAACLILEQWFTEQHHASEQNKT
jgi:putative Holliday junction resolvase